MPTGPKHTREWVEVVGGEKVVREAECRCTCGFYHNDGDAYYAMPDDDDDDNESLSVWDAADIWLSHGMDEDYTFGCDEDELRRAAGLS